MPSTSLSVKGTKNPSAIYIRLWEGKSIDLCSKTGLYVNPKFWDKRLKKIRNVIDVPNRDEINAQLQKLQLTLVDDYNKAYGAGLPIDKRWLEDSVLKFFNRPKTEGKVKIEPHRIYISDFASWWLKEKAPKYKVAANKYMDIRTIKQYEMAVDNLVKFEGKSKILLRDISADKLDAFSTFLRETENYSESTAKRKIGRIKFFCERAEADNLEVNRNYKERIFVKEEEADYKHPYLSPEEIKAIYKLDLSSDTLLDNARDNLIIGVWTGLRISDFLTRLSFENITGDFIRIRTRKTGHDVTIPLHAMVRSVLEKHNGLPAKMPEPIFNKQIKIVGMLAKIDDEMIGGIAKVDKETKIKRKVVGLYKKYKLITSHICRRSFATNHFGKVSNKVIMDVCGWKKEDQMLDYIKATNMESAIALKKHWENNIV